MKTGLGFRGWFYFRMGWSTYLVFLLGAINTLTLTYFLAVDNYPELMTIFPTFEQYVLIMVSCGIPILVVVGYAHYKKTRAYKSEAEILVESNPYVRRNTVNLDMTIRLNLKLLSLILKLSKKETVDEKEIEEIEKLQKHIVNMVQNRSLTDQIDMDYLMKEIAKT